MFDAMYKYMSIYYEKEWTLMDYLHSGGAVFVDEVSRVQEMVQSLEKEEAEWQTTMLSQGAMVSGLDMSRSWDAIIQQSDAPKLYLSLFLRHVPATQPQNIVNIQSKSMQNFHGQ
ncbi:hypothetical protein AOA57_02230, partial [Pseudomonas sp. 2588-5]